MKIYITNQTQSRIPLKLRRIIKRACCAAAREIVPNERFEVSVALVNNDEIHQLNLQHRNMDKPTDVLSFPLIEDFESIDDNTLGDIVISVEQAKIQAQEYAHSLEREIGFLTVHSMLHLFGYDHKTPQDEAEMFELQKQILSKMRLTR